MAPGRRFFMNASIFPPQAGGFALRRPAREHALD
jgi:hypothetical protein